MGIVRPKLPLVVLGIVGVVNPNIPLSLHGEIPATHPTIFEQVNKYVDQYLNEHNINEHGLVKPSEIHLILLTACSDDVDVVGKVSNPDVKTAEIHQLTEKYCDQDMVTLLKKITGTFTNATVIVAGYPRVISPKTDMDKAGPLLTILHCGILAELRSCPTNLKLGAYDHAKTNWNGFYNDVLSDVQKAIDECCKNRAYFVDPGYTYDNAVFTKDPWVFGAHLVTKFIDAIPVPITVPAPEDPMAGIRNSWCKTDVSVICICRFHLYEFHSILF